ncbi:methylaspartate ammonia-lyase [Halorubellus sp. JP-L1]|uniref:methylaspartate ammonia-lyase n=1 Tax=Halorubellus sp. JP-L1 TaxID=2715753 RepID=UPI00140B1397|nr:methylaspartate ammonia-lyase [Halorubellus sp. JP-L1]
MRIERVRAVPTVSGFYFDDQRAIKEGATQDGFAYDGEPVTQGFDAVREAGEALTVELDLSDGTTVSGDCCAVQYSGAGGRDPLFRAERYRPVVADRVADAFEGRDATKFGTNVADLAAMPGEGEREQLHTAVRYGVSQALLAAAAHANREPRARTLAAHLGTTPATEPVPVFGQSGDDRYANAEKMLIKGVPVLPHGLFNSVEKLGEDGEGLREYVTWIVERATELGDDDYRPRIHLDVYGVLGDVLGAPYDRTAVVDYFQELADAAGEHPIQIEGPMDVGGRAEQIHAMTELRDALADADVDVDLVADEWCNTLADVKAFVDAGAADVVQVKTPDLGGIQRSGEAVKYCEGTDVRAYLGGTCNETVTSARACAHVALATDAAQVLAKPGMGFDEGYMVVENEMRRALARDRTSRTTTATADD